ncbi:FUSC family protein [Kineococcus sp. SYSU DK001]|uniref:FUSC family protein n=1 Tax=Kineococcus sp. SYSU DK001 TaxID=3383122 RepID=UPI003D7CB130
MVRREGPRFGGVRELLVRFPRLGLAARTALAALVAWLIALNLPGDVPDTYPYFAPLGAVVGSYSTVRSSLRNSVRAVVAILCGALLSLTLAEVFGRDLLVVPAVVFCATLLAGWRVFQSQGSWVLTVALFVLVAGADHPVRYAVAYTTLTLLGGCVAVALNAALPSVPLARSARALHELATTLADQLDDVADGLRADVPPDLEDWQRRLRSVAPVRDSLRRSRWETEESLRGNVRARAHVDRVRYQHVAGVALENAATRVEELTELLLEAQATAGRDVALDAALRRPVAAVLSALADVLRADEDADRRARGLERVRERLRDLTAVEAARRSGTDRDRQTAGAVVTALRRSLGALAADTVRADPELTDPEAVVPTPWTRPDPDLPGGRLRSRPPGRRWSQVFTRRSLRLRRRR